MLALHDSLFIIASIGVDAQTGKGNFRGPLSFLQRCNPPAASASASASTSTSTSTYYPSSIITTTAATTDVRQLATTASPATHLPSSSYPRTSAHIPQPASPPPPARWSLTTRLFNFSPNFSFYNNTPRPPASRLWNPVNSSPRNLVLPNVPVQHSHSHSHSHFGESPPRPGTRDEYPLLTLPEQRLSRQSPAHSSLIVERSTGPDSSRTSIGLPRDRRSLPITSQPNTPRLEMPKEEPADGVHLTSIPDPDSHDLEAGGKAKSPPPNRSSMHSRTSDGHGDADVDDNASDIPWGPSHPCFPHPNPHVPLDSPLYDNTRIIRIRRDWMQKGDLAPTFANLYPEILDPLISEEEFRIVIKRINDTLMEAFDPLSFRAWLDAVMGVATFWLWDDIGLTKVKAQLAELERWIDHWNQSAGEKEGVRIIPLRRTGYMTLDIQVPDPQLGPETRPNTQQDNLTGGAPQHPEFDYAPYASTPPLNVQAGSPIAPDRPL
ncbi:hypothetical protein K504DRAFT_529368 [Pleomassaria siparia CBS 279.74]|uniref:Ras modification protein ERF4 n=1 Tax=Pleomassaria siparia CBS 279.74 TaxID=1314801 RepID=A0A6G1KRP8_9PLEO|nr:hypothetical protein K504DRAFT_529368 [Pleomassaria siparia CBS 279.74]